MTAVENGDKSEIVKEGVGGLNATVPPEKTGPQKLNGFVVWKIVVPDVDSNFLTVKFPFIFNVAPETLNAEELETETNDELLKVWTPVENKAVPPLLTCKIPLCV